MSSKIKTHVQYKQSGGKRHSAEYIIAGLLSALYENKSGPFLVAVGGPGGTGKSTFSRNLSKLIQNSTVLNLDDYKTSREVRKL